MGISMVASCTERMRRGRMDMNIQISICHSVRDCGLNALKICVVLYRVIVLFRPVGDSRPFGDTVSFFCLFEDCRFYKNVNQYPQFYKVLQIITVLILAKYL
jgi:hypothetical protein